mmetsp:Transcript_7326/g.12388  ORF Transcript_7326/g.12388 Transcript_7326/m.12388 type:complete len:295 (-) Transcript_7326:750-1634(-)
MLVLLVLWSHLVRQSFPRHHPHANVNLLGLKKIIEIVIVLPGSVADYRVHIIEEFGPCIGQINALIVSKPLDPDSEVVSIVKEIGALVFARPVAQVVGLGPGSELETLVDVVVEPGEQVEQLLDEGLNPALPLLVDVFGGREDLDLNEVLVGLEEGELLEEALPGDLGVHALLHDVVRDLHRLLELGDHVVSRRLIHVEGRVHGGEGGRDDWKEVPAVFTVEEPAIGVIDSEGDAVSVVQDLPKHDGVVEPPRPQPVVLEERLQELAHFEVGVLLANVGHQDGPGDSSTKAHHV